MFFANLAKMSDLPIFNRLTQNLDLIHAQHYRVRKRRYVQQKKLNLKTLMESEQKIRKEFFKHFLPQQSRCMQGLANIYYEIKQKPHMNVCESVQVISCFRIKKCKAHIGECRINKQMNEKKSNEWKRFQKEQHELFFLRSSIHDSSQ